MTLSEFIINFVDAQILKKGVLNIPTGHNGGYRDLQTQARLLSHSILLVSKCYELTNDKKYVKLVIELADYLASEKFRPKGYAFYHIITKGKDHSNGLMGQAWTFEALSMASELSLLPKYKELAISVFKQHKFDYNDGLWHVLDITGRIYPKDPTFNHQLWFAATISYFKDDDANKKLDIFLSKIDRNLSIYQSGLIKHSIEHLQSSLKHKLGGIYKHIMNGSILNRLKQKDHASKENIKTLCIGYHAFNTYAFALLKHTLPDHSIWENARVKKIVSYLYSEEYLSEVGKSPYGYPYNPIGFEVPFSLFKLNEISISEAQKWVNIQFEKTYSSNSEYFDISNPDNDTLSFRLYELTRLPCSYLNKINI